MFCCYDLDMKLPTHAFTVIVKASLFGTWMVVSEHNSIDAAKREADELYARGQHAAVRGTSTGVIVYHA